MERADPPPDRSQLPAGAYGQAKVDGESAPTVALEKLLHLRALREQLDGHRPRFPGQFLQPPRELSPVESSSVAQDLLRRARQAGPDEPRPFVGRRIARVTSDVRLAEAAGATMLVRVDTKRRIAMAGAADEVGWEPGQVSVVLVGDGICVLAQKPDLNRLDEGVRSITALNLDNRHRLLLGPGVCRFLGAEAGSQILVCPDVAAGQVLLAHMPTVAAVIHSYAARATDGASQAGVSQPGVQISNDDQD